MGWEGRVVAAGLGAGVEEAGAGAAGFGDAGEAEFAAGAADAAPDAYFFLTSSGDSLPVAMTARGAPTLALPPSGTRMAAIAPVSKDSLSITALSVSISAMTSPCLIFSPSFLRHLTTVPSVMVSLICGMVNSADISLFLFE